MSNYGYIDLIDALKQSDPLRIFRSYAKGKSANKKQWSLIRQEIIALFFVFLAFASCSRREQVPQSQWADASPSAVETPELLAPIDSAHKEENLNAVLTQAEISQDAAENIMKSAQKDSAFSDALASATAGDPFLYFLVDKERPLPEGYEPDDLVPLNGGAYQINRSDLRLRKEAADSLEEMAAAARADGVTLLVSSTYRSYDYQVIVYNRNVREMGQEAADRESARPGYSQHQTGLVVDFGSIDDSFAQTKASEWLLANAGRFGWSLSFPDGYESVTGYRWESWHYRYVGKTLASFIDAYFGGIQQYALRFIYEWEKGASLDG
ncbi:MAG: M15 family metallopeptidase [Treponema sp.]|jgi:D-alanyl-D-alanine carboxypeptidase|nr:M15 family metallopeptidase [Treponema sp.]